MTIEASLRRTLVRCGIWTAAAAASAALLAAAGPQQPPPGMETHASHANDPRVGLKAGLHDAGEAAKNMERLASTPKPEGFFDPKAPGGPAIPPERD